MFAASGCAPRHQAPPAEANPVEAGWTHYRLGEFDSAVRAFDRALAAKPPADPQHLLALYGLATTWNLRTPLGDQDKTRARHYYEDIVTRAPQSDLAAWSMLALARLQHVVPVGEEPDYEAVRAAYDAVIDRFPEHLAGQEAFIYRQATLIQTLQTGPTSQAVTALHAFIDRHPKSGFLSGAYSLLASGYETLHEPEHQLEAELKALDSMEFDPTNPKFENSGAYWKIATIAEFEAGDFATARRFYRRLMDEYPQDIRVFAAEEALRRMDGVEARLRREMAGGGA
ncbi:MAG: tetratricopeptide repeat protein [Lentisphaerae bacterium]|nr:tetratricopeptide repeat protein [Lentisphaerota bacterium]